MQTALSAMATGLTAANHRCTGIAQPWQQRRVRPGLVGARRPAAVRPMAQAGDQQQEASPSSAAPGMLVSRQQWSLASLCGRSGRSHPRWSRQRSPADPPNHCPPCTSTAATPAQQQPVQPVEVNVSSVEIDKEVS